jgi:transcription termination factor NusB
MTAMEAREAKVQKLFDMLIDANSLITEICQFSGTDDESFIWEASQQQAQLRNMIYFWGSEIE